MSSLKPMTAKQVDNMANLISVLVITHSLHGMTPQMIYILASETLWLDQMPDSAMRQHVNNTWVKSSETEGSAMSLQVMITQAFNNAAIPAELLKEISEKSLQAAQAAKSECEQIEPRPEAVEVSGDDNTPYDLQQLINMMK